MRNRLSQFVANRNGAVAILTAFALVPIIIAVGAGIEFMRVTALRTKLQNAVDSAALAALAATSESNGQVWVRNPSNGTMSVSAESLSRITAVAQNYIEQNFNRDGPFSVTTRTEPDLSNGIMAVEAKASAPTFLLGLAGIDHLDLSAYAKAAVGSAGRRQEIAIAFDTTFSMNFQGRKEAAIQAAKEFIHKVMNYPSGAPNPNVGVALVPFNDYVNIGYKSYWSSRPIGLSWLTSTDDIVQTIPQRCWDASTTTNTVEKQSCSTVPATCMKDGENYPCTTTTCTGTGVFETKTTTTPAGCTPAQTIVTTWGGCAGSRDETSDEIDVADENNKVSAVFSVGCPRYPIINLMRNVAYDRRVFNGSGEPGIYWSFNEQRLTDTLDGLTFDGTTYIAPGLLWAWRAVSPEKPFAGWYDSGKNLKTSYTYNKYKDISVKNNIPWYLSQCGQDYVPDTYWARAKTWGVRMILEIWNQGWGEPACPYELADKSIVLMTDGYSTKSASYDDMGRHEKTDRAAANAKLAKICSNIKAKGIKIFTIAFMVKDNDTLATLTNCASNSASYFDASNASALADAFQSIGNDFTRLRLIK